jgi:hypothetical protein
VNTGGAWTRRRWSELTVAMSEAPLLWADWARRQLARSSVGLALADQHGWDVSGEVSHSGEYDAQRLPHERTAAGQFFTPPALADALVALIVRQGTPGSFLDPACGAGELLCAVFRWRRAQGSTVAAALDGLTGWDKDPTAAWGALASLILCALDASQGPIPGDIDIRGAVDALTETGAFDAVVMNPPYLEAKRMRKAQPGLREWLRVAFPELHGAFDLYMAFLHCSRRWVNDPGAVAALLPNKVCQGRYAARFRQGRSLHLTHLVDASRMHPRPFPGTSVYPVLLRLSTVVPSVVTTRHVFTADDVADSLETQISPSQYALFDESPWFAPLPTWSILGRIDTGVRLGDVATVRSTCSFHEKGLRERFVVAKRPRGRAYPYIGGTSFTRRSEVHPYALNWDGWWLRDAQDELRKLGNPLPELAGTFGRPKVVFRQHARRVEAWLDAEGRYATKDVYPIAWSEKDGWNERLLTAIFNSTVFTALYNTVFQGIVVGGETYHYLPTFLRQIPVPELSQLESVCRALASPDTRWSHIDQLVCAAYGISEAEREQLVDIHLRRVGAAVPDGRLVAGVETHGVQKDALACSPDR